MVIWISIWSWRQLWTVMVVKYTYPCKQLVIDANWGLLSIENSSWANLSAAFLASLELFRPNLMIEVRNQVRIWSSISGEQLAEFIILPTIQRHPLYSPVCIRLLRLDILLKDGRVWSESVGVLCNQLLEQFDNWIRWIVSNQNDLQTIKYRQDSSWSSILTALVLAVGSCRLQNRQRDQLF